MSEEKPKKKRKKKAADEENGGEKAYKPNWREVYATVEEIKASLGALGFRRVKCRGVRGYLLVCRKAEEIQMVQQLMALDADDDGQ